MKPIKLVMSAFGPYLEKTVIDFSLLNNGGLYLITGKTGAGKSTIFEALSYGIYGETVSGNKSRSASLLRNDMADDTTETYVEVYFECNGNEYYIKRSPSYNLKALKRGKTEAKSDDDYKTHNSTVCLECRNEGITYFNETEVLNMVTSIIGIDKKNFRKICILAQGEFMSVVKEDTKQRKEVLNAVFETEKYAELTDELKRLKGEAADEKKTLSLELGAAKNLIVCSEDDPLYNTIKAQTSALSATPDYYDELIVQTDVLIQKDEEKYNSLKGKAEEYKTKQRSVSEKIDQYNKLKEKKQKLDSLTLIMEQLKGELPAINERIESCRENPVKAEKLQGEAAVLRSLIPEYKRLEENRKKYKISLNNIKSLEEEKSVTEAKIPTLEAKLKITKTRLAELNDVESKLADKKIELNGIIEYGKRLRQTSNDFKEWQNKKAEVNDKLHQYESLKMDTENKTKIFRSVKISYDNDLACYLASDLKEGCRCPVCGSYEHPLPAQAKEGSPTRDDLEKAETELNKSEKACQNSEVAYKAGAAEAKARIENVRNNAKEIIVTDESDDIFGQIIEKELDNKLKLAKSVQKDKDELEKQVNEKIRLNSSFENDSKELEKLRSEFMAVCSKIEVEKENARHLSNDIRLSEGKLRHSTEREAADEIRNIESEADKLKKAFYECQKALSDHNNRIAENKGSIEQIRQEITEIPQYDVEQLSMEKAELEKLIYSAEDELETVNNRLGRNRQALSLMNSKKAGFRKAYDYYNDCDDLYATAYGSVPHCDRIGIQTYVQMGYLDSILEMANIRLEKMMNNKYKLFRSGTVRNKRAMGGLDIDVLNCHKGKYRRLSTVSGGESFIISLAMAIGLSDMIQQRAGGIHIDSMFIDEGFGTLDDEYIDEAVQALKNISIGNCTIGIISHVKRMRSLITSRIDIETKDNKTTASVSI